jgi:tetratricopeptide (TPR) repeat protein
MQEEQARRQAAEAALQKARSAIDQGDLSGAIHYLQEALRSQPNNPVLQGQLQNVRALKDQRETQERIDALKQATAAMESEEARLAADREAAQIRLNAALNQLGPKITPGTAFQQLQEAAAQGIYGKNGTNEGDIKPLQAPWDTAGTLPLPTLPTTLSPPPQFKRPEDRATYAGYEQDRERLQGEYKALEQQLTTTTDPVAKSEIKNELIQKKSEMDAVVGKMLDLSFHAGSGPPPAPGKE